MAPVAAPRVAALPRRRLSDELLLDRALDVLELEDPAAATLAGVVVRLVVVVVQIVVDVRLVRIVARARRALVAVVAPPGRADVLPLDLHVHLEHVLDDAREQRVPEARAGVGFDEAERVPEVPRLDRLGGGGVRDPREQHGAEHRRRERDEDEDVFHRARRRRGDVGGGGRRRRVERPGGLHRRLGGDRGDDRVGRGGVEGVAAAGQAAGAPEGMMMMMRRGDGRRMVLAGAPSPFSLARLRGVEGVEVVPRGRGEGLDEDVEDGVQEAARVRGDEVDAELHDERAHLAAAAPERDGEEALEEGFVQALVQTADALDERGEHQDLVLRDARLLQPRERLEQLVVLRALATANAVQRVLDEIAHQRLRLLRVKIVLVLLVLLRRPRPTGRGILAHAPHPVPRDRREVHRGGPPRRATTQCDAGRNAASEGCQEGFPRRKSAAARAEKGARLGAADVARRER
jgi:hypothetical protein